MKVITDIKPERTIEDALHSLFDEFCVEPIVGTGWTREPDENGLRVFKIKIAGIKIVD